MTERDPAMAARLARYYDLDLAEAPADVERYLALAAEQDGPVLELAAGTGRVAIPLALAGHAVTAVDIDAAMLDRARAAWGRVAAQAAPGGSLELLEADMLSVALGARFGLVLIALNSLTVLATRERQATAVRNAAAHLQPGGRLAVDCWLPDVDDLAVYDSRVHLEWQRRDPETGEMVAKTASARHSISTGDVELTIWFDAWPAEGGPVTRTSRSDHLRLVSAGELAAVVEHAGLTIESIEGDHAGGPFGPGAERALLVARLV